MLNKGSKLYSIRKFKCPKCHEGDIYKSSLVSMQGIYNMHKKCSECGQPFELEPGFYWGAMYIGYGLSSIYMLSLLGIFIIGYNLPLSQAFTITISIGLIVFPFLSRFSRVVWLNIVVNYNKKIDDIVCQREAEAKENKN